MLRLFTGVAAILLVCAPAALAQSSPKQIAISPSTLATLSKSKVTIQEPTAAPRRPARTAPVSAKLTVGLNGASSANRNVAAARFGPVAVRENKGKPPI